MSGQQTDSGAMVYLHKPSGRVTVYTYTRGPVADTLAVPLEISNCEIEERLGKEVLTALDNYHVPPFDNAASLELGKKMDRQFARTHEHVSVRRRENGTIEVVPMQKTRGGGGMSMDEHRVKWAPPSHASRAEMSDELTKLILDAFAILKK